MEGVSKVNNYRTPLDGTGEKYFTIHRSGDLVGLLTCPICLGFLRNTRTFIDCLHRFCKECIDKAMPVGKNECPTCRRHCASRRALRDDPRFDTLISSLYPNLDQLEKEKYALLQESLENKILIKRSIEETFRHQCKVINRKQAAQAIAKVNTQNPLVVGVRRKVGRPARVRSPRASAECEGAKCEGERSSDLEVGQRSETPPTLNAGGALADHEASSAAMALNELCLTQEFEGGLASGEIDPTNASATVAAPDSNSTRAPDDGGVLNGTGKKPLLPDLNDAVPLQLAGPEFDGGSCSDIATTQTEVYPPWQGGEDLLSLHLLCDTATEEAASRRIEEVAVEGTQIKEIGIPQQGTAAVEDEKKRRRVLILPRHDSDSSTSTAVGGGPKKRRRVLILPRHDSDSSNAEKGESVAADRERSGQKFLGEGSQYRGPTVISHQVRRRGRPRTLNLLLTPGNETQNSEKAPGKLCTRTSALLNHLVASSQDEEEEKFDIQVMLQPFVEPSKEESGGPGLRDVEQLHLCCSSLLKIQHLSQYVASRIPALRGRNIQILIPRLDYDQTELCISQQAPETMLHAQHVLILRVDHTLQHVWSNLWHLRGNMVLFYRETR